MLKFDRALDLRGVPALYAPAFRWYGENGFRMCKTCCQLAQNRDKQGMALRAELLLPQEGATREEWIRQNSFYGAARLHQQVIWLCGEGEQSRPADIYNGVEAPYRVSFDLLNLGKPDHPYPAFDNGVELWCAPYKGNKLLLEEIRSTRPGRGYATKVLRTVIASADLHGVQLFGFVEAHAVDGKRGLTDKELYAWYDRLGFVRDPSQRNLIFRLPRNELSAEVCRTSFADAKAALKKPD